MQRKITLLLSVVILCFCMPAYSQYIPPNIDFESGSLTSGWVHYTGTCCPIVTPTGTTPVSGRHTLVSGTGTDPYGGFPVVSPGGGSYSMKLGNASTGAQAERSRYYVRIPSGSSEYSLIFHYAVVLEDPSHTPSEQPRMEIKAFDSSTGLIIPCDSFYYVASSSLPGFLTSTVSSSVIYKPWTAGTLKLSGLAGRTIGIDFATGDCQPSGHFGYGYVDMTGGLFANILKPCGASSVTLSGPDGYSAYRWCDTTFTTTYATTQNVTLGIPTAITIYALVLTPYTGYGCPDTLYTKVVPQTPCSGTPPIGGAFASRAGFCSAPDTLFVTGYELICGLAYQWQSSPDGTTWTNMTGDTLEVNPYYNPYTALYYRCAVTCIASGLTNYTTPVYVPAMTTGPGLYTVSNPPATVCNGADFYVSTCGASVSYSVATFYGDGAADTVALTTTGVRHANILHNYGFPGTYSIRQVLYDGAMIVDSTTFSFSYLYCSTIPLKFYFDVNSNCTPDVGETNLSPVLTQVDSNGVPIDTISALSGLYYFTYGAPGTVYDFRVISPPGGQTASCPTTGVVSETIIPFVNLYTTKNIGFNCMSSTDFDIRENVTMRCYINRARGTILIDNIYCHSVTPAITMNYSPRYTYHSASPSPASYTANSITWNLGSASATSTVPMISFELDDAAALVNGDTIYSDYTANPIAGDLDTTNNIIVRNDTVNGSYDPNYKEVIPQGFISAGTKLRYVIHFENTGRDTAFNIHLMDTLSGHLDVSSLEMIAASAEMNMALFNVGGQNIIKFDFPNINLLDSSHHGLSEGMVVFSINTRTDLPVRTIIANRAGIYFDHNPVVMTNTVNNIIGGPDDLSVAAIIKTNKVQLFPNPATDELTIKMDKDAYTSFVITNQVGQELIQQQISTAQTKVNIKSLPAGLYYITLKGDYGTRVQKFVKT